MTLIYTATMVILECADCHMPFAITRAFEDSRHRDRTSFFCPAGHSQWFPGKTLEKRLADETARAERNYQWFRESTESERRIARRLSATQGVVTRTKRRIAAGVCPCCNRSFQNLHRHMAGQHPDYAEGGSDGS